MSFGISNRKDLDANDKIKAYYEFGRVFLAATFFDRADFRGTRFGIIASPVESDDQIGGEARQDTGKCVPEQKVDFSDVSFQEVNFSGAQFDLCSGSLNLTNTGYSRLTINELDLDLVGSPDPRTLQLTLQLLEKNFRDQGQLQLANQVFYQRLVNERRGRWPIIRYGEQVFIDWPAGYGVRWQNPIYVSVAFVLFFALIYFFTHVVRYRPSDETHSFSWRISDVPVTTGQELQHGRQSQIGKAWDALFFSFSVFTKFGTGQRVAIRYHRVVILEWFLGLIMLAVFIYTLSNTIPALQRLISTVL